MLRNNPPTGIHLPRVIFSRRGQNEQAESIAKEAPNLAEETEAALWQLKQAAVIFIEIGQSAESWEPEIWKLVEW